MMQPLFWVARWMISAPIAVLLGVLIGLLAAPGGGGFDWAYAAYDRLYPVLSMQADIVSSKPGEVLIALTGTKNRACDYIGINSFAEEGGRLVDVNEERVDIRADGGTKPPGSFSFGTWRVWPVFGATRLVMATTHSCANRLVTTRVIDLPL